MRHIGLAALLMVAGCGPRQGTPAVPQARTFLYDCGGGMSVVARIEPEAAWVALSAKTVRLLPVSAESGARYEGDGVLLWIIGEQNAMIEVEGRRFDACTGGVYADTPPPQVF